MEPDHARRRFRNLLSRHSLRGTDAIHLASALLLQGALKEKVTFACADARLVSAARAEGLDVVP